MNSNSYRQLNVWIKSRSLVKDIYQITAKFPKNEMYGLVDQMRRAAISVPSNIAEGQRRGYKSEYRRFVGISLGSCAELETQLFLACDLEYLNQQSIDPILIQLDEISKMLFGLMKSLEVINQKPDT